MAAARALIASGADLNVPDGFGTSPLVAAIQHGDEAFVAELLRRGARLDGGEKRPQVHLSGGAPARVAIEQTPMSAAVFSTRPGLVRLLLRAGASVDRPNARGETPLLQALQFGKYEVVGVLLDAGADPNRSANDGTTPFLRACRSGRPELVAELLRHHADPNLRDAGGQTPLGWLRQTRAASPNFLAIRKLLEKAGGRS
jgi:ankyrin repeat protein